ncbi:TonB-dependent receptor [Namhaeicola litoreus]|uniref:TonB-dependent receptor n=1 Tax=Namhaeicola litoreus TaxID=1052145 RepID=A0ABW3Y0M6_9FLAO
MKAALLYLFIYFSYHANAQNTVVFGQVLDDSDESLSGIEIYFKQNKVAHSDTEGLFFFSLKSGQSYSVSFESQEFNRKKVNFFIENKQDSLDLGRILLQKKDEFLALMDFDELLLEDENNSQITGFLNSSRDLFSRTVAFQFSSAFFRPRSLGTDQTTVLFNGNEMNKMWNGRANWNQWGGLNDVTRHQIFYPNSEPNPSSFGAIGGAIFISSKPSDYRKGIKASYALANRTYNHRTLFTYHSGSLKNNWMIMGALGLREGKNGYKEGAPYASQSYFLSVEKLISDNQSLYFTGFLVNTNRGKVAPIKEEVFDLKNDRYNAYWGSQNNQIRNARMQSVAEPTLMLNYDWQINRTVELRSSMSYQFGKNGHSRLDYNGNSLEFDENGEPFLIGGGTNPDPTYYQKLPSYYLRFPDHPDYTKAYLAEQKFLSDGQINWEEMYDANINSGQPQSIYALYEDRTDDQFFQFNTNLSIQPKKYWYINTSLRLKYLISDNYANVLDLLGGEGYLDVYSYSEDLEEAQNDLQNPNRIVQKGDVFKYHFKLYNTVAEGFGQLEYKRDKVEFYTGLNLKHNSFYREGLYENGRYPGEASLGKSEVLRFLGYGLKTGLTYKLTGRHLISTNLLYLSDSPKLQNSFINMKENNQTITNIENPLYYSADINYMLRMPRLNVKLSSYYLGQENGSSIRFYYADGLTIIDQDQRNAFVQEIMTNISTCHMGLEAALNYTVLSGLQLNAVAAAGKAIYAKPANISLSSDDFKDAINFGKSYLKNYHLSNGPQQAFSLGLSYNSPHFWWLNLAANYFDENYISVAPLLRTTNFLTDVDGLPIENFDSETARSLLKQKKIDPYYTLNLTVGKSWRIKKHTLGTFLIASNLSNSIYQTGGFEQSRNANYQTLLQDQQREKPLFSPKYWYGYGQNYFLSVYWRI